MFLSEKTFLNFPCAQNLEIICDKKVYDDEILFKLNIEKVSKWLIEKVENLVRHFVNSDEFMTNLYGTKQYKELVDMIQIQSIAIGIVGEYIDKDLLAPLYGHYK
jgi:hypothetical protein